MGWMTRGLRRCCFRRCRMFRPISARSRTGRRCIAILRRVRVGGGGLFVGFAGHTVEVIDAATGEIQRAEIFVAVLGASSFIYAEATASQALPDWIGAHVNALTTLGGGPRQIVSATPKAGI